MWTNVVKAIAVVNQVIKDTNGHKRLASIGLLNPLMSTVWKKNIFFLHATQ